MDRGQTAGFKCAITWDVPPPVSSNPIALPSDPVVPDWRARIVVDLRDRTVIQIDDDVGNSEEEGWIPEDTVITKPPRRGKMNSSQKSDDSWPSEVDDKLIDIINDEPTRKERWHNTTAKQGPQQGARRETTRKSFKETSRQKPEQPERCVPPSRRPSLERCALPPQRLSPERVAPPSQRLPQERGAPPSQRLPPPQRLPSERGAPPLQRLPSERGAPPLQRPPPERGAFPERCETPLQRSPPERGASIPQRPLPERCAPSLQRPPPERCAPLPQWPEYNSPPPRLPAQKSSWSAPIPRRHSPPRLPPPAWPEYNSPPSRPPPAREPARRPGDEETRGPIQRAPPVKQVPSNAGWQSSPSTQQHTDEKLGLQSNTSCPPQGRKTSLKAQLGAALNLNKGDQISYQDAEDERRKKEASFIELHEADKKIDPRIVQQRVSSNPKANTGGGRRRPR